MHDANGNRLKVGDEVLIPAIITELQPSDEFCNVTVKSLHGRRPDGTQESISAINTGVIVLLRAAKAATVALLLILVACQQVAVADDIPHPPGWYPVPPGVRLPIPDEADAIVAVTLPVMIMAEDAKPVAKEPAKPKASYSGSDDALDEVNEYRAKRGLPPFKHDAGLTAAAKKAAKLRATNGIAGHLYSDFACLPAGTRADAAGCGALEDSWGWGTCCMNDNYSHAGAAWQRGADGKRYMHLFVSHGPPSVDNSTSYQRATSEPVYGAESAGTCSTGSCGASSRSVGLLRRRR